MIACLDLLIFRLEAQLIITNKVYNPAMSDPTSDEHRQLRDDICHAVSSQDASTAAMPIKFACIHDS